MSESDGIWGLYFKRKIEDPNEFGVRIVTFIDNVRQEHPLMIKINVSWTEKYFEV